MKKYFTSWKYKKYNHKRAYRSLKSRIRFNLYLKEKRKRESGLNYEQKKQVRKLESKYKSYVKVYAPQNFSFVDNSELVLNFLEKLKNHFDKKEKVFVVLKEVTTINYDAIVVLLSIMIKFKSNNIDFDGDFPVDPIANTRLRESGFFDNLYKRFREEERYHITSKNYIHTHAWKNVDSKLTSSLISDASKYIWGESRRCQGVQRTMIELMQNTNNHAVVGKEGEKHWWLSVNPIKPENKVIFSFIDYGVGIFNSLQSKKEGNKFFGWAEKIKTRYTFGNNAELLKLIMDGEMHRIVTGKHFRGKGLPGIKEALLRKQISNLFIITNNVFADIGSNNYRVLNNNFEGTFIYWELNDRSINNYGTD